MINDLDNRIERYIDLHGKVSVEDVSHAFKLPKREARKHLESLVSQGYIRRLWYYLLDNIYA